MSSDPENQMPPDGENRDTSSTIVHKSGGWKLILAGVVLVALLATSIIFGIQQYTSAGLHYWLIAVALMVGGGLLSRTEKLERIGVVMVWLGVLLTITLLIFGSDTVERKWQTTISSIGGIQPHTLPLSAEEQAARIERAAQDAAAHEAARLAAEQARAPASPTERTFGNFVPFVIPGLGTSIEITRFMGTSVCWDSLPHGVTFETWSPDTNQWVEGVQENVHSLRFKNTGPNEKTVRARRMDQTACR